MDSSKTYKGIDLIEKVLEFIALTPDERSWNVRSLSGNKPRLIRLKQIEALLKAFSFAGGKNAFERTLNYFFPDLKSEIKSLLNGKFIKDRDIEEYKDLAVFVNRYLKENELGYDKPISLQHLCFIYPKMIDFKIKLREIMEFNSGWLEASSPFVIFHILLTNSISSDLKGKSGDLDHVLELFINPGRREFSEKELIEKFGFPTDNLHDIDMENY